MTTSANAQGTRVSDGIGVTEWEEWSFANIAWWTEVAGDQDRSMFGTTSGASGVAAIVDPDEWDDIGSPSFEGSGGFAYNSQLLSPEISLAGADLNSLTLQFASSWRDENFQEVNLEVSYDGGAPIEVLRYASDPASPNFTDDAQDDLVTINLPNPGSASTATFSFNMFNAANDWWWAVDNIDVSSGNGQLFFEDFESVTLGQPIDEPQAADGSNVYSQVGPSGWVGQHRFVCAASRVARQPSLPLDHSRIRSHAGEPQAAGRRDHWRSSAHHQPRRRRDPDELLDYQRLRLAR